MNLNCDNAIRETSARAPHPTVGQLHAFMPFSVKNFLNKEEIGEND